MLWDKSQACAPNCTYFFLFKQKTAYEIKVLRNGKLARTAKFSFGSDYKIVDTGIVKRNNLGTLRVVVPAQIVGDLDGQWVRNAYTTDAFFGSPLTGFAVP